MKFKKGLETTRYMTVSVHSVGVIISAVMKNGTVEQAKALGNELWKISKNPYVIFIKNEQNETIKIYKA